MCVCADISRLFQKQQELEPVVTAVTNESTEIMIDSVNTSQSQPIEGRLLPEVGSIHLH